MEEVMQSTIPGCVCDQGIWCAECHAELIEASERLARIERAVADTEVALAAHCDRLREAADGLLVWWRSDRAGNGDRAGMHPKHVANRVRKIANSISKAKEKK